jgi:hypothetical protein
VVDKTASKGRKLRYAVHTKLANFMAPLPYLGSEAGRARVVASLFQG